MTSYLSIQYLPVCLFDHCNVLQYDHRYKQSLSWLTYILTKKINLIIVINGGSNYKNSSLIESK